uniref:Chromosome 16 open reading frame 82 n=1 Tax=Sciurus vulgaris TaxID=55149 RepID=A0A8D2DXS7_SCIVU
MDKPIPLPPAFPKEKEGGPSAWNAQRPEPGLQSRSLEPGHPQPRHAGAAWEPLRGSGSTLGKPRSSTSLERSMRQPGPEEGSNASLLSSGYRGDTEASSASLPGSRVLQPNRRPHAQAGSVQGSTTHAPSPLKSRRSGGGHSTEQAGGQE